jgi:uncharacterized protein
MRPDSWLPRFAALLALLWNTCPAALAADASKEVVIGEERTLFSKVLNEERAILISKPLGYERSQERYPLLVVLSRGMFAHSSSLVRFLAAEQVFPDLLVVAVDMAPATRTRDLTPAIVNPTNRAQSPTAGGAPNFRAFLSDELLPWLDQNYRTRPYRVLVGHSLGGLFALDTILTQPGLFNSYVAISPSLWWDDENLIARADAALKAKASLDTTLYLSTASEEHGRLRGSVQKLAGVLEARAPQGLRWKLDDLPLELHDTSALRGTQQGLEFAFSDWVLRNALTLYDQGGIEAVERFYARRDQHYGAGARSAQELSFMTVSGKMLELGRLDEISTLLARYSGTVRVPGRALVQLADAYRAQGRNDRAVEHYRLALKTDPNNTAARKALGELDAP